MRTYLVPLPLFLRVKTHISWHIAASCMGVLIGVALAAFLPDRTFAHGAWPVVGASLFVCATVRRLRALLAVSLCAGLAVGLWRGAVEQKALLNYVPYYGKVLLLQGRVHEDAAIGQKGEQRLSLANIRIGGQTFHGQVWASTASGADIKRGDTVFLHGALDKGFGSVSASMYRATLERIEHPYPGDIARRVRDWFADAVRDAIPAPQASLGVGYLTGQRSALPASLDEQLRVVGLTHAVVASGYNLTVLVACMRGLFARVSKYLATLTAFVMIVGFVLVTGFSPSMSRAGLVAGLSLAAWYWGRVIHPLVLLPFAACVTVLAHPAYMWGDIGWFLSFAAFAGVVIVAPLLRRYFWGKEKKTGIVKQTITDTFSAQLTTAPIILYAFGKFAVYALPANVLVLPLVPLAMLATFCSGIVSLAVPQLAEIAGWPAELILGYMVRVVKYVAELPGAQEQVDFTLPMLAASYLVLVMMCLYLIRKTNYTFHE